MSQPLAVQEKKELVSKGEKMPARATTCPVPTSTRPRTRSSWSWRCRASTAGGDVDIRLEDDVLRVEARIDTAKYEGMEPLYTEYNVGHFARAFTLPHRIDQQQIGAALSDGVLTYDIEEGAAGSATADRNSGR